MNDNHQPSEPEVRFLPSRRGKKLLISALLAVIIVLGLISALMIGRSSEAERPNGQQYSPRGGQEQQFLVIGQRPKTVTLQDLRNGQSVVIPGGRPQVVEFIATWCQYCQRMRATIKQVAASAPAVQLIVIGAAQESDRQVRKFAAGLPAAAVIGNDRRGRVADAYLLTGYPTLVAINSRGRITAILVGQQPRREVQELFRRARLPDSSLGK